MQRTFNSTLGKSYSAQNIQDTFKTATLQEEIKTTMNQFEQEFSQFSSQMKRIRDTPTQEQIILKQKLNKRRAENHTKQLQLQKLQNEANAFEMCIEDDSLKSQKQSNLEDQIEEAHLMLEESIEEQERIQNKKAQLKSSVLVWKERLDTLREANRKITKMHRTALFSKKNAFNTLVLSQNQVIEFKDNMEKRKKEFLNSYYSKKELLDQQTQKIKNAIERISQHNLATRKTQFQKQELVKTVETEYFKNEEEKQKHTKQTNLIQNYLRTVEQLNRVLERQGRPRIDNLSSEHEKAINMHKHFLYLENSYGSQFQELTLEFLEKQKQCDQLSQQLDQLKEENKGITLKGGPKTYSQLKNALQQAKELWAKNQSVQNTEFLCIRLYAGMLNLGSSLVNTLTTTEKQAKGLEGDLKKVFQETKEDILNLQKGFSKKRNLNVTETSKPRPKKPFNLGVFKTQMFESRENPEKFATEVKPYFSLSQAELYRVHFKVNKDEEKAQTFSELVKEFPTVCYFIDLTYLEKYLESASDGLSLSEISELLESSNARIQQQFIVLYSSLKDLVVCSMQQDSPEEPFLKVSFSELRDLKKTFSDLNQPSTSTIANVSTKIMLQAERNSKYRTVELQSAPSKSEQKLTEEELIIKRMKNFHLNNSNKSIEQEKITPSSAKTASSSIPPYSPKQVLNEVLHYDRKMTQIRGKEAKASSTNKVTIENDTISLRMNKKPWTASNRLRKKASKKPKSNL